MIFKSLDADPPRPDAPAATDADGPRRKDREVAQVEAVRAFDREELWAGPGPVAGDSYEREGREHDHDEREEDPVRHSKMLVAEGKGCVGTSVADRRRVVRDSPVVL
jgi:hypothetical protein